jgi:hypothetical protein
VSVHKGGRPAYIGLVNACGSGMHRAGLYWPNLDVQQLLEKAEQRTGFSDFGDDSFQQGLQKLIGSLESQAELSQVGRLAAHFNILDYLCVRLRLINSRSTRPDIAEQSLAPPLVILGLPRTGTTILYELIAQDPTFRSPASWEVAQPVPPARKESYATDPRIAANDRLFGWLKKLTPGFEAIHAIGATLPQECVYLLASHFASEQFSYMYHIPEYRSWLLDQDMTAAYQWHARFLQHLQVDFSADRWLLKAPAHLAHLKYLVAQYPDISIVWAHRRPLDAVASFSSLVSSLRSGFSDSVDRHAVGQSELQHSATVLERGVAERGLLPEEQFFDASFADICDDPLVVVESIYAHFGWNLGAEAKDRMQRYLQQRPRFLYGEHKYSWDDYGLSAASEEGRFDGYMGAYGAVL